MDEEVDVREAEHEQHAQHDDRERRRHAEIEELEALLIEPRGQDVGPVDRPALVMTKMIGNELNATTKFASVTMSSIVRVSGSVIRTASATVRLAPSMAAAS